MTRSEKNYSLYVDALPETLTLDVPAGETYRLNIAAFEKLKEKINIVVNVHQDARFLGAFADFTDKPVSFYLTVNLLEDGSECDWHLSCLSKGRGKKYFETSVNHLALNTNALMSNYGIAKDESKMTFTGVSSIEQGAHKAKTRQEAKIIVFDPQADGICSPDLKISDNDVVATHAAVIGRLNQDHLFYLESRGLSEKDAKRLIALGYLKPVEDYFTDKEVIAKMDRVIEEGF